MRAKRKTVTEAVIERLAESVGQFEWRLRACCIRAMLVRLDVEDTGIVCCPIGMLVYQLPAEVRLAVTSQARFADYAERIRKVAEENHETAWCSQSIKAASMREYLRQSRGGEVPLEEAHRAAAALVAHAQPTHPAVAAMTGISRQTINRIAWAADFPETRRFGPALMKALGLKQSGTSP